MRCGLKLEEYDWKIIHKDHTHWQGNINAEALSRNPIQNDEPVHNVQSKGKITKKTRRNHKRIYGESETQVLYEYHGALAERH